MYGVPCAVLIVQHRGHTNIGITIIRQSRLYIQPSSWQLTCTVIIKIDKAHNVL